MGLKRSTCPRNIYNKVSARKEVLTVRFGGKNTKDDVLIWSVPNRSLKTKKDEYGLKLDHCTLSKVSSFFLRTEVVEGRFIGN